MATSSSSRERIDNWTVDDVADWLETIGLGHKADVFKTNFIDGKALIEASSDDLTGKGLSNLQAKKILKSVEKEKKAGRPEADASEAKDLKEENSSLKKELRDLGETMLALQKDMAKIKAAQPAPAAATIVTLKSKNDPDLSATQQSVTIDFCTKAVISGNQTQILTVTLKPGERVRAEPGLMMHMSSYINMETHTGGQGFRRLLTGQTIFLTEFHYAGPSGTADTIAFAPDFPAQIIPVRLDNYGGKIICQKGSLLCSANTVDINVEFAQTFRSAFFGGEGFVLQGINGRGYAFLVGRGVVVKRNLRKGERLRVSTGALVGFQAGVRYDVEVMRGVSNTLFGGEGLFVTTLTGPGIVWIESQPLDKLLAQVADRLNKAI